MNEGLIAVYKPKAIIFVGISLLDICRKHYNLRQVAHPVKDGNQRIIERYSYKGTPWLFVKHLTGGFGFSNEHIDPAR